MKSTKNFVQKKIKLASWLCGIFLLALWSCDFEADDQTLISAEQKSIVDPAPVSLQAALKNNHRHKILMAIIDSGVDYNHPDLVQHMHFDFNNEQIIGLGYDFVAQDHWPSPYLAKTAYKNNQASESDRYLSNNSLQNSTTLQNLIPELKDFLEPQRDVSTELKTGSFHGTHVAGLMTYDDPSLGLIPYRVLPLNKYFKDGHREFRNSSDEEAFQNIKKSIELALKAGARVINMSLELSLKEQSDDRQEESKDLKKQKERGSEIKKIMEAHPEAVFVAAAGNNHTWVDADNHFSLPCGIGAKNLLCVGASNKNGSLASFSNISLSGSYFIAAPGVSIVSAFPTKMCDTYLFKYFELSPLKSPFKDADDLADLVHQFKKQCASQKPYKELSGTSMASPIAARALGKILVKNPHLSGEEAILRLITSGEVVNIGGFSYQRIRIEKPSWYPQISDDPMYWSQKTEFSQPSLSRGYFEFVAPAARLL